MRKLLIFIAIVLSFMMTFFAVRFIVMAAEPPQRLPILLYHHILPDDQNRLFQDNDATISLEHFTAQMQFLYDNGFHTVTLDELEAFLFEGVPLPPNSVMIQFDDGYYSNLVYAYPVLQSFGFTAQLFFITHLIEDQGDVQPPMDHDDLTWTAAKSIVGTADVFETASHSHNLHRLSSDDGRTLLYNANVKDIIHDTLISFKYVNNHRAYAYPRGQYNDVVRDGLERAGITMAFTIREGYVTADADPMALKRYIIFRDTSEARFRNIVMGRQGWLR
ncbi:MAG: polysaccharide deacetylase family protein [Defluviitaleaceae bacterium]|nr:polysaccharide deacetylase family protein [Defluviitaleaceae bacterium]